MSDGPHRSLNMRAHWKASAQRAANFAHTTTEVSEAMSQALKRDILEAPIAQVREIMDSNLLFPRFRIEQLEALRASLPRSAVTNSLIDCAIEAADVGVGSLVGIEAALRATLEDIARPAMRSIDEHYQREAGARASRIVRERLDAAFSQLDCGAITHELLAPESLPSKRSITLPLQRGIDQGPPL